MSLMALGHVLVLGGVVVGGEAAPVRGYTFSVVEDLDGGRG